MTVIRYADDAVLGFEHEHEARAFVQQLHERLATFDLELHPDKTRIIEFGRHAIAQRKRRGERKPETFDFLGFTHFCTYSRKYGSFVIGRKTIKKRLRARLKFLKLELRRRMHDPIAKTGAWLHRVLQGHLNYFSVSGNDRILWALFKQVRWYWLKTLRRRSQRGYLNWATFVRHTERFFPKIRVMHPYPLVRFDARTQGRSPVR
jgi:restriction endonuclease Mrr